MVSDFISNGVSLYVAVCFDNEVRLVNDPWYFVTPVIPRIAFMQCH